ncbi:MAG: glycosyltransferase family 4 protein [Treponema sp.]|nr:glycosyltransferase family 4 protein [Treponema sp.]
MNKHTAILIGDISCGAGTERAVTNLANMLAECGSQYYYPIKLVLKIEYIGRLSCWKYK